MPLYKARMSLYGCSWIIVLCMTFTFILNCYSSALLLILFAASIYDNICNGLLGESECPSSEEGTSDSSSGKIIRSKYESVWVIILCIVPIQIREIQVEIISIKWSRKDNTFTFRYREVYKLLSVCFLIKCEELADGTAPYFSVVFRQLPFPFSVFDVLLLRRSLRDQYTIYFLVSDRYLYLLLC